MIFNKSNSMPSKMALGQLAILKQKHKEKQKQNQKWSHNGLDQNIIAESENHLKEIIRENYAIRLNKDFLDTPPKSRFSKKKKESLENVKHLYLRRYY